MPNPKNSIPKETLELLGEPALLEEEDRKLYDNRFEALAATVGPYNILDWFVLKSLVDDITHVERMRHFQAQLTENSYIPVNCVEQLRWAKEEQQLSSIITSGQKRIFSTIKQLEHQKKNTPFGIDFEDQMSAGMVGSDGLVEV